MNFIEQVGGAILFGLGILWTIVVFIHTISIPLSEEKMREIIREEVKKIIAVK